MVYSRSLRGVDFVEEFRVNSSCGFEAPESLQPSATAC